MNMLEALHRIENRLDFLDLLEEFSAWNSLDVNYQQPRGSSGCGETSTG